MLATHDQASVAAVAIARAAGATVLVGMEPDPRSDPAVVARLAAQQPRQVLAVGRQFGSVENLERRLAIAATGVELPGGGQVLFPHRRMIAMYGRPGTPSLGVLGEQSLEATIRRAKRLAGSYTGVSDTTVIPAFEVITTLAAADAGRDGDYSSETAVEDLRPWIDAARTAGIYVVLDLQPGRTSFLTQARRYEELLAEPHVGLALDPEWRLKPGQRHLRQIGSVDVSEVNAVAGWLAGLTRQHRLPQKLLILHQFRLSMIPGRSRVDTSHDELAILIHADGNGTPGQKHATYRALTADAPEGVWWGWKNFYDEDSPTFTPAQTMEVNPPPLFVSYQ